jgi:hypothetical protein
LLEKLSDAPGAFRRRNLLAERLDGTFAALVSSIWHGKIPQDRYIEQVHGIPEWASQRLEQVPKKSNGLFRAGQAPGFWI